MALPKWLLANWQFFVATVTAFVAPLFALRAFRQFLLDVWLGVFDRDRVVRDLRLERAKVHEQTKRGDFWEESYAESEKRFAAAAKHGERLEQEIDRLKIEVEEYRAEINEAHAISRRRMEGLRKMSADLEAAKLCLRANSARLVAAGGIPEPEPVWQTSGYNVLHAEDVGP